LICAIDPRSRRVVAQFQRIHVLGDGLPDRHGQRLRGWAW
jgi:hypothetical protein